MRIFEEKQRFDQWWLYAIFAMAFSVLIGGIYENSNEFRNFDNPVIYILLLLGIFPLAFILLLQLETRIDQEGIKVKFSSLPFSKRYFPWKEIKDCYVRTYSPVSEYGGWGIRSLGKKKAYNIKGNLGIQIVTHDNRKFLIGTQNAEAARAVLRNYEPKVKRNTQH